MVHTGHGKTGKPGNVMEKNSVWKSHGNVMEKRSVSGKMKFPEFW